MNDDRDHELLSLFTIADEELPAEAFTAGVLARTDRLKRRVTALRIAAVFVFLACAWLLAGPMQNASLHLTHWLVTPLFPLENSALAGVLLPFNSIAFLIASAFLVIRRARRRVRA